MTQARIDQYAVMGNPIAHSKSPSIHQAFAQQTEQNINYSAILVEPDKFKQAVHQFIANGGKGLNITVPFKQQAYSLADELSARAAEAEAVNTYILDQNKIAADNTDGVGLVRDLIANHKLTLTQKTILILGAGGAVRGVLGPLLRENPKQIIIANRTVNKAILLAEKFSEHGKLQACGFDDDILMQDKIDIIINGTAASLQGDVPNIPEQIINDAACYDMMYAKELTTFLSWCKQKKAAHLMDGLGMLVEQAAESFYLWRNIRPDTQPVLQQLRQSL